jgi:hypothetical protein
LAGFAAWEAEACEEAGVDAGEEDAQPPRLPNARMSARIRHSFLTVLSMI